MPRAAWQYGFLGKARNDRTNFGIESFTHYFAYGSNLAARRLRERGIRPVHVRAARLEGYRLCFTKRSTRYGFAANIAADAGHAVWGALYRIAPEEASVLDTFESVHLGHYRRRPVSVFADNTVTEAFAYQATPPFEVPEGLPAREYLQYLLEGAREHRFPADYIDLLARAGSTPRISPPAL